LAADRGGVGNDRAGVGRVGRMIDAEPGRPA
jgi:hypothetical protein